MRAIRVEQRLKLRGGNAQQPSVLPHGKGDIGQGTGETGHGSGEHPSELPQGNGDTGHGTGDTGDPGGVDAGASSARGLLCIPLLLSVLFHNSVAMSPASKSPISSGAAEGGGTMCAPAGDAGGGPSRQPRHDQRSLLYAGTCDVTGSTARRQQEGSAAPPSCRLR
ncbi:MAG: hypothetical protein V4550_16045 [Gemmatimonadota bacterium]